MADDRGTDAGWPGMAERGTTQVDAVVIGAGQAGLSVAYHLRRRGFRPLGEWARDARTFVVLDAEETPGGAWQHRWRTLTMSGTNRVHHLPGLPLRDVDPNEAAADAVPRYFTQYEQEHSLRVRRPVRVRAVRDAGANLLVETSTGNFAASVVLNATGTWRKPFRPTYPGVESFPGRQVHSSDFSGAHDFRGERVVVVGGGISGMQHVLELAPVAMVLWLTRREPRWREDPFDARAGREAVALVEERVRRGLPPMSVVSVTGLPVTDEVRAARADGTLHRYPMFTRVDGHDVVWTPTSLLASTGVPEGAVVERGEARWPADSLVWATGFRPALDHLAPLRLRERGGGILMDGTTVVGEPRVQLLGYGPSASTIGANRAGRDAARAASAVLDARVQ